MKKTRFTEVQIMGVLRQMEGLASEAAVPKTVMIDAIYLKAHRTASSLGLKKGGAVALRIGAGLPLVTTDARRSSSQPSPSPQPSCSGFDQQSV